MAEQQLMKGHVWADHKHKMQYPCIVEEKHDEIRCRVVYYPGKSETNVINLPEHVHFETFSGKPVANMESFHDAFLKYFRSVGPEFHELDMGILVNENFNDSYRWVRSTKGHPKEKLDKKTGKVSPALDPSMVEFLLFDLPLHPAPYYDTDPNKYTATRHFHCAVNPCMMAGLRVKRPDWWPAWSERDVHARYEQFRAAGMEGAMVKSAAHTYQRKRSYDWLKMKPESEADGIIVGFTEATASVDNEELGITAGDRLGRAGSVTLRMEDGSTASPHGIAHDLGWLMWQSPEQYIGKWATMNYMERDRNGGYRHPTFARLREGK